MQAPAFRSLPDVFSRARAREAVDLAKSVGVGLDVGWAVCIQSIEKGSPMFGSEYDYVVGNCLIRVSGTLPL